VTLAGTHGRLERSATLGFAMATFPLPVAMRVGDVILMNLLASASAQEAEWIHVHTRGTIGARIAEMTPDKRSQLNWSMQHHLSGGLNGSLQH
jgi:hypothetical protein